MTEKEIQIIKNATRKENTEKANKKAEKFFCFIPHNTRRHSQSGLLVVQTW